MRFLARQAPQVALPGVLGTARVATRTSTLLPRLRPGDIAVLDQVDLDRATAQALVDRGVAAVVDASAMISGRYANLGPEVLARAGVALLDQVGEQGLAAIRDGRAVRVHEGAVYDGDDPVALGRHLDLDLVLHEMDAARAGLVTQLETLTHNATEFLRREQDLLLHGRGTPRLATRLADRPVLVVARGDDHLADLRAIRRFIRDRDPVLVAVDEAGDDLRRAGYTADVLVLSGGRSASLPGAETLRAARDVVVVAVRGAAVDRESLIRLGLQPASIESAARAEDVALVLANSCGASMIVGVGLHTTLEEFLDRQREGLASTFLTRLKLGPRLVEASTVARLYSGRVRARYLLLALLLVVLALAAFAVTPLGLEWAGQASDALGDLAASARGVF